MKTGERIDTLKVSGYKVIQEEKRFCFGIDAVLLSDFSKTKKNERVCDLGTGTGIIPILLAAKNPSLKIDALEIQNESVDMAKRSVELNNLQSIINIVEGDIKQASSYFEKNVYDVVTTNPPYMIAEHGEGNGNDEKTIARHEVLCTLDDVVRSASELLKSQGRFYMIHKPFRLAEIMAVMMKYKLEPKRMRLCFPYVDKEPTMVLIEGVKCAKSRITVESPLIVYEKSGGYTKEVQEIYAR
ncbi:MAG: tRNA1(Val) (adenine(37)-N6)-methyltransferase [Treponema sp.]|nr:tRNA1(Val) (adenine(37)-N6)-methyltransferase [Treponema sp.]